MTWNLFNHAFSYIGKIYLLMDLCQNGTMFGRMVMHHKSSRQSNDILLVNIQTSLVDVGWYEVFTNQTMVRALFMGEGQPSNDFFDMSNEIFMALDCKCIRCCRQFLHANLFDKLETSFFEKGDLYKESLTY
jgi:hypothetical protein